MTFSIFKPSEALILLDAQQRAIEHLSADHVVTDVVKWKIADIVLKIGRHKQKCETPMNAREIADDAVILLGGSGAPAFSPP